MHFPAEQKKHFPAEECTFLQKKGGHMAGNRRKLQEGFRAQESRALVNFHKMYVMSWLLIPLECFYSAPNMTGRRFHRTAEAIPRQPWKSKSPFAYRCMKISIKRGTRGARARYDVALPPFISVVRSPGRPVTLVTDLCMFVKWMPTKKAPKPKTMKATKKWLKSDSEGVGPEVTQKRLESDLFRHSESFLSHFGAEPLESLLSPFFVTSIVFGFRAF